MKPILIAALVAAGPSFAQVKIEIPAEKVAECQAQGGCGLISRAQLEALLEKAFQAGKQEDKETCRNRT